MASNYLLSSTFSVNFGTQLCGRKPSVPVKLFSGTKTVRNCSFKCLSLPKGQMSRIKKVLEMLMGMYSGHRGSDHVSGQKDFWFRVSNNLDEIRRSLKRQEDSIIFSLIERTQFRHNPNTYAADAFQLDGFNGSLMEYILSETEKLHSKMGGYKCLEEHPFFPDDLSEPLIFPPPYSQVLHHTTKLININNKIWDVYFDNLLRGLVEDGSDGSCGSAAVCDTICLQALSKRIHCGKYVAESKFREYTDSYTPAILAQDRTKLMNLLTNEKGEVLVRNRVELKAKTFAVTVSVNPQVGTDKSKKTYKIDPSLVVDLYERWVMPLTKRLKLNTY